MNNPFHILESITLLAVMFTAELLTMGTDAAANDLAVWNSDGLHPNAAGQVLLEAILRPVIDAI